MEITEDRYFEAFGLEKPAGEQAQESAEPAEDAEGTGVKAQEPAEPAEEPAQEESADGAEEQEPAEMSAEQRRENAARRRQQEKQAEIDRAVADALTAEREKQAKTMKDFFAGAGLKNTLTGEKIESIEQYQAWHEQMQQQQLERDLNAGKLTKEGLHAAIGTHPAVIEAQKILDQTRQRAEQAQADAKAAKEAEDKRRIEQELANIHKMDASINTVADLLKMPNAEAFKEKVNRGYSFEDAYILVNRDRIAQAQAKAAQDAAMAKMRGKDHLAPSAGAKGAGASTVPGDIMMLFRQLNPRATEADIIDYYNKHQKK